MWLLWYALRVGLSKEEALDSRMGELIDLMRIEQIKHEGARLRRPETEGEHYHFIAR